jgi:TonB-linked SusC/RagA family outer membrane protein
MRLTNQALLNAGGSTLFPESMISAFENGTDRYKYPNTDWFDVLFKTAPIQEHNLSIMGGTERSNTFLSFNYMNHEGMMPNVKSQRYGLRANIGLNVNKWFQLDGRINYNRKISDEPYNDIYYGSLGRVFDMLAGAAPYIAPYTRDGRFGAVETITDEGVILYDNRNPLIDANNGKKKTETNFLSLNVTADIKLADFMHWRTNVVSDGTWNMIDNYNQTLMGYTDSGIPMITKNYNREGIERSRRQVSTLVNNIYSTLNFDKTFNEIHDISAIAGLQLEDRTIKNSYARRSDPPKEGLTEVDAGTSGIQGEGNMQGLRMFSYFGRLNYALANKYLFEANVRADASSRFKKENRWGFFPGFSLGWRISEEGFMGNQDIFSNLKLRASWGQLGNQNIADYWPYLTVIEQNNGLSYSYNGSFAPGAAVTSLVDDNITWETTSSLDIGLDAGFLNNKINIEADYFYKKTTDIIVQLPIPLMMGGLTPPYENVGEMVNKGFEFTLNFGNQIFDRDRFGYNIGLNMTYIDNQVTKFRGGKSPDQLYLIREGYSYQTLYGYKATGIYQSDEEAAEHMYDNSYKPIAGNLKFEDLNNDGKLGFEDKQEIGNTIPKFSYGLSTSFNYKGFDLNLLFQGLAGVHGYNQNEFTHLNYSTLVISTKWRNAWSPDNRDTKVPILYFDNAWDRQESSYWVKELSFLKLKNIQLGYDLPESLATRLGLEKLYLYLNAQNVFVLVDKDFEGYDPEKDTFSHGINQFPVPRIISFGINLNF